jgi:hypothetical protein
MNENDLKLDAKIEEIIDGAVTYSGEQLSENDRAVLREIILNELGVIHDGSGKIIYSAGQEL